VQPGAGETVTQAEHFQDTGQPCPVFLSLNLTAKKEKTVPENKTITWGDVGRKVFGFLYSMQFSLLLLGIILAACVAGSVIPQNAGQAAYEAQFGAAARWITALGLDHIFGCWWFAALAALLCLNLCLCSLIRLPQVWRRWRHGFHAEARLKAGGASFTLSVPQEFSLAALGCRRIETVHSDGKTYTYAAQNTLGVWGSWLCHLGMLLVIVGFAAGQALATESVVYGIPGSTQPIGDTGYLLTIDDFEVALRDDFTVEQYTARLTVVSPDGTSSQSGTASVNHPMTAFGMSLYQDSTGWANYVDIAFDGQLVKQDLLCVGEYTTPDELPSLALLLTNFYPDLTRSGRTLTNATPLLNNPHALYSLYYQDQLLGMNLVEMDIPITVDRYSFTLHDPVQYTLIVIRTDPTAVLVGLAALVMVLGILLAFYCRPQEFWYDGETLFVRAEKAPELLRQQLELRLKKEKGEKQ